MNKKQSKYALNFVVQLLEPLNYSFGLEPKSEEPLKSRDQKVAEVRVDARLPDILIFRRPCSYQKVPLLSY